MKKTIMYQHRNFGLFVYFKCIVDRVLVYGQWRISEKSLGMLHPPQKKLKFERIRERERNREGQYLKVNSTSGEGSCEIFSRVEHFFPGWRGKSILFLCVEFLLD